METTTAQDHANSTPGSNMTDSADPGVAGVDFWIGLGLAIVSSVFIGSSFILKKKGLLNLAHRAGDGGYGYLKEWMWWAGLTLMGLGELCNFTAYAFAPATVVTPLGALSVLVSAVLVSYLLEEHLNLLGKLGCFICILGSIVVVLHAPKDQELQTMDELEQRLAQPAFIAYVAVIVVVSLVLIFIIGPRYGTRNPMVYITITGTIGSLSVMGCKGLGVAIQQTFHGENQFDNWLTYFVIITIVVCITTQLNYMNKALDVFNTSVVTPMLYVVFTAFVLLASAILFEEWYSLTTVDMVGIITGFLIVVSGIFLLNAFKDAKVSLSSVSMFRQTRNGSINNSRSTSRTNSRSNSKYFTDDLNNEARSVDVPYSQLIDDNVSLDP